MADAAWVPSRASVLPANSETPRHSALVRVTHWITALCFFALLITGLEIVISHPRFYWGETGNVLTTPLFILPIPASRATVPTGYSYMMPDQNGWSRLSSLPGRLGTGIHRLAVLNLRTGYPSFLEDLIPL